MQGSKCLGAHPGHGSDPWLVSHISPDLFRRTDPELDTSPVGIKVNKGESSGTKIYIDSPDPYGKQFNKSTQHGTFPKLKHLPISASLKEISDFSF